MPKLNVLSLLFHASKVCEYGQARNTSGEMIKKTSRSIGIPVQWSIDNDQPQICRYVVRSIKFSYVIIKRFRTFHQR